MSPRESRGGRDISGTGCTSCPRFFTTYGKVQELRTMVVKRAGNHPNHRTGNNVFYSPRE
jgi:transcriptional regulator NrdR family protein